MPAARFLFIFCFPLLWFVSCAYAPPPGYAESAPLVQKRTGLYNRLVTMLPPPEQLNHAAREEARWLADTAYKASAAIARQYNPCLAGWFNNRLVNSHFNLQERGLCWHYQHDLYRELRRRQLSYFRLGCCVRDQKKGSEHNCVYVAPRNSPWPQVLVLDPWRYSGRLKVITPQELQGGRWKEDASWTRFLAGVYTECHRYPMEHWARVKSGRKWNDYVSSWLPEGTSSRQGMRMQHRMYHALKQRGGKLVDY